MDLSMDCSIATIVESMLPTFSDKRLGLYLKVQFNYTDHGFGPDGNTQEREGFSKRYEVELLFIRPSNYTKVLGRVLDWDIDDLFDSVTYNYGKTMLLKQYSDHDSCWRSDGFSEFHNTFTKALKSYKTQFRCDWHRDNMSEFHHIDKIKYVEIETADSVKESHENRYCRDYLVKIKKELSVIEAANLMPKGKDNVGNAE